MLTLSVSVLSLTTLSAQSQKQTAFQRMLQNYYEEYLALNPTTATAQGDNRYNHLFQNSISEPYRNQTKDLNQRYLDSLKSYPKKKLSGKDRVSYSIFEYELKDRLEALKFKSWLTPVSQMFDSRISFALMASGNGSHPFRSVKDYDDFLYRVNGFVAWTDTAITNMRRGMKEGYVQPRVVMEKVIPQLKAMITDDPVSSMFYNPIKRIPETFSAEDKARLEGQYKTAITESILPSLRKLLTFIEQDYLPATRQTVGISAVPEGKEYYDYLVRSWTTTNLTAEQIHQIGLSEVERIRKEMEALKTASGFTGSLKEFFRYLENDPRFFPFKTEEEVVAGYYAIHEKMKPHLQRLFNMTPKSAFEVRPVEKYRAASTAAHYYTGTPDGSRPGIFYVPVPDPSRYKYWIMEDLFLHEAIPGHHYERSLVMENTAMPANQKIGNYGAYTEGWGLYSERLGSELGLYTDIYQKMGQLQNEMHRAIRLVVDVGLHVKGWTREEAIRYSMENEPISEANAVQEIERYISMPGQALSYKIGELKIIELRKKAEEKAGKKFDVRSFHDQVLNDGPMPLEIFEEKLNEWIRKLK
jgi:uncharacterized protein (DUF885 family)